VPTHRDLPHLYRAAQHSDQVSNRWGDKVVSVRTLVRYGAIALFAGAGMYAASADLLSKDWPLSDKLKHIAAAPNCDAARAVGLAPARRGAPGYYTQHDADRDGIACEPYSGDGR
jgi:hypothetical protein